MHGRLFNWEKWRDEKAGAKRAFTFTFSNGCQFSGYYNNKNVRFGNNIF